MLIERNANESVLKFRILKCKKTADYVTIHIFWLSNSRLGDVSSEPVACSY